MELEYCTQCPRHCSFDSLKCGRGMKYVENLKKGGEEMKCNCEDVEKNDNGMHNHHKHCGRHRQHCKGKEMPHSELDINNCDDLSELLRACGRVMHHREGRKYGQGRIMHILSEKGEIYQKELQETLGIQPGSISEILSKMEDRGLIERIRVEEDRRKTIVRITDVGRSHVEEHRHGNISKDMFTVLNEEEQGELKRLLKVLLENWRQSREE